MCSKTLPFNKVLIKKDWKITRWVAWIIAVVLFFTMTLGVISVYSSYQQTLRKAEENQERYRNFDAEAHKSHVKDALEYGFKYLTGIETVTIILLPIAVAALLFGEEKRRKTFEVLSTMPFTRYEIFFNKVIIAFLNVFLPYLINALIMIVALGLSKGLRDFYSVDLVMSLLGANIFRLFVMLSFSLFFASLTGTTISQVVLTLIFFVFPIGFTGLIDLNMIAWGYTASVINNFLFNSDFHYYTIPAILANSQKIPTAYYQIIRGIIMLIASKLLFDRNKLERSGETLEFESIETFFKIGVTVCTSLLFGVVFKWFGEGTMYSSSNTPTVLGYIAGIALGWLASNLSIKLHRAKG